MGRNNERRERGGGTVQEVKDKWENLHSTEKKKSKKTKQKELCNFSKDGFHHQPLALDENVSTRQSHCLA